MAKRPRAHRADGPTEQGLGGRAPAPRAMLARSGVRAPRERRCCMTGDPNEDRRGQMREKPGEAPGRHIGSRERARCHPPGLYPFKSIPLQLYSRPKK